MTVYLIVPVQYLRSQSGLLRLWVTAIFRSVTSRGVVGARPLHVVLDEAASLGPLEALGDMLTIGRGYGMRVTAVFQSMAQLKSVFPDGKEGVILSNTAQVFFAINDNQTAEYVSARLGDQTVILESGGTSESYSGQSSPQGGNSQSRSTSVNQNWAQHGRRLMQASELLRLDPGIAVTFLPGTRPIATRLIRYYEHDFRARNGVGWFRILTETAFTFLVSSALAVAVTAVFAEELLKGRSIDVQKRTVRGVPAGR